MDPRFEDIDVLKFGNTLQLAGAIFAGEGNVVCLSFPDEVLKNHSVVYFNPSAEQWERLLAQTDVLDVRGPGKAILRKSQRQIDASISWKVFKRDGYRCRYCGEEKPLTVDHIDLWEEGGVSTTDNLLAACKQCNRKRGNTVYDQWLASPLYAAIARNLSDQQKRANLDIVKQLEFLKTLRTAKQRSR